VLDVELAGLRPLPADRWLAGWEGRTERAKEECPVDPADPALEVKLINRLGNAFRALASACKVRGPNVGFAQITFSPYALTSSWYMGFDVYSRPVSPAGPTRLSLVVVMQDLDGRLGLRGPLAQWEFNVPKLAELGWTAWGSVQPPNHVKVKLGNMMGDKVHTYEKHRVLKVVRKPLRPPSDP